MKATYSKGGQGWERHKDRSHLTDPECYMNKAQSKSLGSDLLPLVFQDKFEQISPARTQTPLFPKKSECFRLEREGGAIDFCVSMPGGSFKRSLEVPQKYVSCSMSLNLVRLQKQSIPSDLFSTPCACERARACMRVCLRVGARRKLVIRA